MPFNRINNFKAMSYWLSILSAREGQDESTKPEENLTTVQFRLRKPSHQFWCPGLLVVPLPHLGPVLGYVDVAFYATFLYVVGSVVYVIDSFFLWGAVYPAYNDDSLNPAIYLNILAAALFVINAMVCFLDWYLQVQQLSAMNMMIAESQISERESIVGGFAMENIPTSITWYYFFNNIFFMGAALIYLIQGMWMEDYSTDLLNCSVGFCGQFWINFWGSMLYLFSSIFSYLEFVEDKKERKRQGLVALELFPIYSSYSSGSVFPNVTIKWDLVDWFGWGDVLYVLTSLIAVSQAFFMFSPTIDDDTYAGYYLLSNVMFLIDSLAYQKGYLVFIYDMRKALFSGQVEAKHVGAMTKIIGDNLDDLTDDNSSKENTERKSLMDPIIHPNNGRVSVENIKQALRTVQVMKVRNSERRSLQALEVIIDHGSESSESNSQGGERNSIVKNPLRKSGVSLQMRERGSTASANLVMV